MAAESIREKRNKIQDISYLVKTIILPIVAMGVLAFVLSSKVDFVNSIVLYFMKINIGEIGLLSERVIKTGVIFIILWIIFHRMMKKRNRTFADNIRGDYCIIFYRLASALGYEKVSMVHKSIPLQFKLLNSRVFKKYDLKEERIKHFDNGEIEYCKTIRKGDVKAINILIPDTYEIRYDMLPDEADENETVMLKVEKKSVGAKRFHSDLLIDELNAVLKEYQSTTEYNLFLFTNPVTNKKIYENVFNTKTDNYTLRIYFFDNNNKRFSSRYKIVHV